MQLSRFLFFVAFAALPVCLLSTSWLYLYPLFHGCDFPAPALSSLTAPAASTLPALAPFRLLALGDPQLEGDSSLPDPNAPAFPAFRYTAWELEHAVSWRRKASILHTALRNALRRDVPARLEACRKRLDLWGNDLYLAHIVRQLRWWTRPTHVAVLGDLLGSQWISDGEFASRATRFWDSVFKGMERVPDALMAGGEGEATKWGGAVEVLGEDKSWANRVINIAGNHDIGYAGDLDEKRIARFEEAFGKVNWDIVFTLPAGQDPHSEPPPALRIVVLNSMNLDTPAKSQGLQRETYDFMTHVISTSRSVTDKTHATVLLTHIPLHKEAGLCVDEPFFDFFDSGAGVKEQNMLSPHASKTILESIFGLSGNPNAEAAGSGRRGVIINGHDHAGCDVVHYISQHEVLCPTDDAYACTVATSSNASDTPEWRAVGFQSPHSSSLQAQADAPDETASSRRPPHMREITLRSMMGDFSGYAGFLSAWFDDSLGEHGEWKLEFATCGVGVQHWWWAVHVTDLVTLLVLGAAVLAMTVEYLVGGDDQESGGRGGSYQKQGGEKKMHVDGNKVMVGVDKKSTGEFI